MIDIGDLTTRNAWRAPGRDAIIDVPNGRRLTFAQLEERANRLAHGLRDELGIAPGERVAILSTNAAEIAETFFACAKAGLVAMPLNWRLAVPEQARILADGEPAALIYNHDFAADVVELQRRNDIAHWIEFAPGSDSTYEELLARGSAEVPSWSAETGGERPVLHPLHGRHHRHLEGRPPQPRGVLRGHGQPGRGGADRGRRRLHAAGPDVPHPCRAGDDLPRSRQAGRADELRAARDAAGDRGASG